VDPEVLLPELFPAVPPAVLPWLPDVVPPVAPAVEPVLALPVVPPPLVLPLEPPVAWFTTPLAEQPVAAIATPTKSARMAESYHAVEDSRGKGRRRTDLQLPEKPLRQ
jgi:hypothetical protein